MLPQAFLGSHANGLVEDGVRLHVMLDQPVRSLRDEASERFKACSHVVTRVNRLADIVQ